MSCTAACTTFAPPNYINLYIISPQAYGATNGSNAAEVGRQDIFESGIVRDASVSVPDRVHISWYIMDMPQNNYYVLRQAFYPEP